MIARFMNLERKQFFRSSYWQKSIAINILMVFLALYFIIMFLALGVGLFPILEKLYPDADPFVQVNNFVFYWLLGDLMMRFFLQKLPVMDVKPLLVLPLKKSKIVHYVLNKSASSFFNFLPLFAIVPFSLVLLSKDYQFAQVAVWACSMMLFVLIINFLNFIIESKSSETEFAFLPILLLVSGLLALNHFNVISFSGILAVGINSIVASPWLMIVPVLVLVGVYLVNFNMLIGKLYIDGALKKGTKAVSTNDLAWTRKLGAIAPFLQLDLKLIWRNKRPRSTILMLVMSLFYGLIFYPNPTYQDMPGMLVFVGIFITGIFMINFGQFIPAWDSSYYNMLMSQNIKYKNYLDSKYKLMMASAVLLFVLSIPYVYFGWEILLIHFAAMVYNIGVNTHVLLYGGSFNRKKIELDKSAAFNYQGTGAVQWIIGFPLMALPILLFYISYKLINYEAGIATLILLGVLGMVFHQKLMKVIVKRYKNNKYAMIAAFSQSN